jgi:hypothetical protein
MCYFPCEGPNFADFSLFRRFRQFFCLVFIFDKLLNLYYSVSRVLLRLLGGVIFISVGCFITLFTLCPFVTKTGSNFYFGPGMYFQTDQVIFVPEWPKGEFVSILALFYVWRKSLMCNDAVNRDSTFRVMLEDSASESEEFQVPCQPSGRCVIPSGHPSVYCSIRSNDVSFHPEIRQTSIICSKDLVKWFGLDGKSHARTPMSTSVKISSDLAGKPVDPSLYRSMIGSLLYLTADRPDIAFNVGVRARFQANPKESHLTAVKRIIKYVNDTLLYGIWYSRETNRVITGYSDIDWAGNADDRKSTSRVASMWEIIL